jgi:hypothetical protein
VLGRILRGGRGIIVYRVSSKQHFIRRVIDMHM